MSLSFNNMKTAVKLVVKSGHVPNIVGLQGIGKSDLVREFAKENGYAFAEVTCSLIQEGDLAMPYISTNASGEKEVCYAINKIITNLEKAGQGKEYAILFLDEFNRASTPSIQSELMNLVLQREVVGHKLAENVRVILAMNPSSEMEGYANTDYSVSFSDNAIMGRVVSLDLRPNLSEWLNYGSKELNGKTLIHPIVRGYLSSNNEEFITKEDVGHVNNTPRGWLRVSDILYIYEEEGINSIPLLKNLVSGTLAKISADRFCAFYKQNKSAIDYNKLALSTLNAPSYRQWDKLLFEINDAELDKVFKIMLDCLGGDITEVQKANISKFIVSTPEELMYSWVTFIERNYSWLYTILLEDDEFSDIVVGLLVNIKGGYGDVSGL